MATVIAKTDSFGTVVSPSSFVSDWQAANAAGFIDGDAFTFPIATDDINSLVSDGTLIVIKREQGRGTYVAVRALYDNTATVVGTTPKYVLAGRRNNESQWEILPNMAGNAEATIACDPGTDMNDNVTQGRFQTTVDAQNNVHDSLGCSEFVVLHTRAIAHTGGSAALAFIQVKIY